MGNVVFVDDEDEITTDRSNDTQNGYDEDKLDEGKSPFNLA